MAELEPGAIFAGHRIEGIAGRGGFGVVYRATHIHLDHVVALKLISSGRAGDENFRERFKSESRIAVSIRHPNVVAVHNAGEEDGLLFVTMDFIEGTDLRGLLTREGRLDPETAVTIVRQLAAALDAAHEKGLVHRDIKPGNVLIDERNGAQHVYLTDFGLSKQMDATSGVTASGAFVGTLDYVAPEQIRGDRLDARTDVYALGCVMFELLSGDVPFASQQEKVAKIYAHLQEQPPELIDAAPEVPAALSEVVWRSMSKAPDDRHPSAGDFARAAAAALEGRQPSEPERNVGIGAAAPTQVFEMGTAAAAAAAAGGMGETAEASPPAPETVETPPPGGGEDTVAVPPPAQRVPAAESDLVPEASTPGETVAVPAPGTPGLDEVTPHPHSPAAGKRSGRTVLLAGIALLALAGGAYAVLGAGDKAADDGSQGQASNGGGDGNAGGGGAGGGGLEPLAEVSPQPVGIDANEEGTLFISSRAGQKLDRVAAGSGQVLKATDLGGAGEQLNVDPDGDVWVAVGKGEGAAGEVQRFDSNGGLITTVPVGTDPRGVVGGEKNQWVVNLGTNDVTRVNRTDNSPTQIAVGAAPARAAEGSVDGATLGIWISNSGDGTLSRITALGDAVSTVDVGGEPRGIAATEDLVWVADQANNQLFKVTPSATPPEDLVTGSVGGEAGPPIDLEKEGCEEPRTLAPGFGSIWITCGGTGNLLRVDDTTGKAEGSLDVGPDPEGVLAVDGEAVFVTSSGEDAEKDPGLVFRIDPDDVK